MDYERKYKEVYELITDCVPDKDGYIHIRPKDIFTELAESEDEKIRKEIIEYIKIGTYRKNWIAWLEKQGEQKPAEWSEEDERMLGKCIDAASGYYSPEDKQSMKDWLKSLKDRVQPQQKQEWCEEDEKMISDIVDCIIKIPIFFESIEINGEEKTSKDFISKATTWLKSLRPQATWKPSEQQMKALCDSIPDDGYLSDREILLDSLYKDLKAL